MVMNGTTPALLWSLLSPLHPLSFLLSPPTLKPMVHTTVARYLLQAGAGSPSEASNGEKYSYTMPVIAIFVILFLGLSGSLIPPLVNVYLPKFNLNERYGFRFFNGLAAGLILAVGCIQTKETRNKKQETRNKKQEKETKKRREGREGNSKGHLMFCLYIHSIPDSIESFDDAFGSYDDRAAGYAWGGLCAMIGSLMTFFCEEWVHRYFSFHLFLSSSLPSLLPSPLPT